MEKYRIGGNGRKYEDLTNKKFNKLLVLGKNNKKRGKKILYECICDCGNITYLERYRIINTKIKSCGCSNYESKNLKDLTGKKFGLLTVINRAPNKGKETYWNCLCECTNNKIIRGMHLKKDKIISCGCYKNSKGEDKIEYLLKLNNIEYKKQYIDFDCRLTTGGYPRFDFIIFKDSKESHRIEYDGEQHFINRDNSCWNYKNIPIKDKEKNKYCINNNIKLIRIPYYHYDFISINDILENSNFFIQRT